ncbi:MAG: tRNA uridine-5-carboxymethylaminomethyl(34) synthesis GTPase MnmE [Treponema sp.]|jgi:tRNA modification GTPase|nr:tRNA uridine-5-carboxymethylaminomethyl(34) synthesis GTPase MnmE [Treponema sp.]
MAAGYGDTSPIAAQAAGGTALALIRTSGRGTLELLAKVFSRPKTLRTVPGSTVVHGWITAPPGERRIDEVLVSVYRPPRSYTGEEGADISCHGGGAAARAILEILHKAGFRNALPGEFTFRAFMNGKIDLTRSESVMELVSAKTRPALERAARRLSGSLEGEVKKIRELLLELTAAVEMCLDYSEDEAGTGEEEAGRLPLRGIAEEALERLRALSATYRREKLYQEGALAVIAGRPNAGKSSLFNALVNEDRSIVTEIPGTTRDWIEGRISLDGIPLRLADTAGLRSTEEADRVEALGIERSRDLIREADLVLYLADGSLGITEEDAAFLEECEKSPEGGRALLVWNKADIREAPEEIKKSRGPLAEVSARTGKGVEGLCGRIKALLTDSLGAEAGESPGALGTLRQKELTDRALSAMEESLTLAAREEPLDLIAPLLRDALDALGEITGEVSSADILERMFSRFCLGK